MNRSMLLIPLLLILTSCSNGVIKTSSVLAPYLDDIQVRLVACQYQVKCDGVICAVKWRCPQIFNTEK